MSGKVSLLGCLVAADPQEAVQDSNEVDVLLLVLALLNVDKELNAASVVLENSIDDQKGQSDCLGLSLDFLDDLEEQTDVVLSIVFLEALIN